MIEATLILILLCVWSMGMLYVNSQAPDPTGIWAVIAWPLVVPAVALTTLVLVTWDNIRKD